MLNLLITLVFIHLKDFDKTSKHLNQNIKKHFQNMMLFILKSQRQTFLSVKMTFFSLFQEKTQANLIYQYSIKFKLYKTNSNQY